MCYHIAFEVKLESILDVFPDLVVDKQLEVEYPIASYINGFHHQPQQVMVRSRKDGKRHLTSMRWGYLPNGVKNLEEAEKFENGYKDENGKWHTGYITLNAVGEELLQKKLYKDAALNRRCVVFIQGFYEWYHHYPIGKRGQRLKTPVKYPHHIYLKDNPYDFTMIAGIWNPWKHEELNEETGELEKIVTPTMAFVTAPANEICAKIHNSRKRMPTILTKELAEEWMQDGLSEERIIQIATYQYPSEKMDAYSIRKDFQEILDPRSKQVYPEIEAEFC